MKNANELVEKSLNTTGLIRDESIAGISDVLKDMDPQKRIKTAIGDENNKFIDPLPYMISPDWSEYYFPKDGHATKLGNEKLAEVYFDYLTKVWDISSK